MNIVGRIALRLHTTSKFLSCLPTATGLRRYSFLPASYHLEDVWAKRLELPLVKLIRLEQFYVELKRQFETQKSGSSLDVDLFASAVQNSEDLGFLTELLAHFRATPGAIQIRDSTCNSVVRAFLDAEQYEPLMVILADKAKYGMFLDHYTANLLMDKFISIKRASDAARVSIDMMLQEDFGHPLTRELSLYSCLLFLETADWNSLARLDVHPPPPDTGEEVLIYVPYLKNEFFDDHFDLVEPKHRLGKTLFIAGHAKDDVLGRSCQILGLGLYEKWNRGVTLLENYASSDKDGSLSQKSVESFLSALTENLPADEQTAANLKGVLDRGELAEKKLRDAGKLKDISLLELSDTQVKAAVKEIADIEAQQQQQRYEDAMNHRTTEINRQVSRFEVTERLRAIEERKLQLKAEEEVLFFFEMKGDWEKRLTPVVRASITEGETKQGSSYDYRVEDPRYVIPQIADPPTLVPFFKWQEAQDKYDKKIATFAQRKAGRPGYR